MKPAAAAETLAHLLERAREAGLRGARLGPMWITDGPDDDVVRVMLAEESSPVPSQTAV